MVGETVTDVTQTVFLNVLLDGVERFLLRNLHLGVGPAGNLDDHVQDAVVLISEERDVMPRRDDISTLLEEHTVL